MPLARRSLLAAVAALATPAIGRAANAQPIRIGEINSYTAVPAFTLPYRNGWQLAVAEINAAGGVLGRPLEVISRDDAGKPADAIRLAGELVNEQKVDLLAGGFLSNIGLALSDFAKQHGVLYIAGEPLTDALVWEKGHRLLLPPAPLDLHAGRHAGAGRRQTAGEALGDGGAELRVRPVERKMVSPASESRTARCRVRGRAVARARQDRRRRHRRRTRRGASPMRSST